MKKNELSLSTVSFRPLSWDIPNDRYGLYIGIYNIVVNNDLVINLIPKWDANKNILKIEMPLEFDEISTSNEAKTIALFTSNITITENNLLAGKTIQLKSREIANEHEIIIIYVNKKKYNLLENEIKKIIEEPFNPQTHLDQIKDLDKYNIGSYLIEVIHIFDSYKSNQK